MYQQDALLAILTSFAAFHIRDSGQYSSNTIASSKFAVVGINKSLVCKGYSDLDIVKLEQHETFCGKICEFFV